jgi:hypothetical protein
VSKSKTSQETPSSEEPAAPSRVDKEHGGEIVEAIAPKELELMNDPNCKHENMTRDPSETDFNAFICDNPKCGIIAILDKS